MEPFLKRKISQITGTTGAGVAMDLLREEPLSIRIQGNPYTVVMRTPGDEIAHVAGFCLGEGLVDAPEDFNILAYCEEDANVVTVTLAPRQQEKVADLIHRRGFISQTSCGICGKELVEDLRQAVKPVPSQGKIDAAMALEQLNRLARHQPLREKTRASHAAAIYGNDFSLLSVAEDVGRHNALDKAVGKLFLDKGLHRASLLLLSSRISYELVQKGARAGIPVIFAVSRPTALAVELAEELGITLASFAGKSGIYVYCCENNLK